MTIDVNAHGGTRIDGWAISVWPATAMRSDHRGFARVTAQCQGTPMTTASRAAVFDLLADYYTVDTLDQLGALFTDAGARDASKTEVTATHVIADVVPADIATFVNDLAEALAGARPHRITTLALSDDEDTVHVVAHEGATWAISLDRLRETSGALRDKILGG